jgi:chromosome partitioning protein
MRCLRLAAAPFRRLVRAEAPHASQAPADEGAGAPQAAAAAAPAEDAPPPADDGLVDVDGFARMAAVPAQEIGNWRRRYDSFPAPVEERSSAPLWERQAVAAWLATGPIAPTHVLSFINLKGGVGKTTTAIAVAEFLAREERKHVLLIDLDPQTNATVTLISEDQWADMDREGRTIAQLFEDYLNQQYQPRFDIEKAIARRVSTVDRGIERLDLLPSSIRLIDIEERIPMIAASGHYTINPLNILSRALAPVIGRYDYIIVDCPPSLGTVTKNGLRISTGYVIPTIPDMLSTWGIYQIVENVDRFARDSQRSIPALGIVATKVQANNLHARVISDLKGRRLGRFGESGRLAQPPVFESIVPQSVAVARSADVLAGMTTLRQKYGEAYTQLHALTREIKALCDNTKS